MPLSDRAFDCHHVNHRPDEPRERDISERVRKCVASDTPQADASA